MSDKTGSVLTYQRAARRAKDGHDGVLYLHHFGTGWQHLIFSNHDAARDFALKEGARFAGP